MSLVTVTRDAKGQAVSFATPSAVALALSIAMKAELAARTLHGKLGYENSLTPWGTGKSIIPEQVGDLFDYFEQCIITVSSSFLALESYCNLSISNHLTGTFDLHRRREGRDEVKTLSAPDLERTVPIEEKLATVLPKLLNVRSPKGSKMWQHFVMLKRVRDATTHLKSHDQYPLADPESDMDEESLLYQYLNANVYAFPKTAVSMIHYFEKPTGIPRWLVTPLEEYGLM